MIGPASLLERAEGGPIGVRAVHVHLAGADIHRTRQRGFFVQAGGNLLLAANLDDQRFLWRAGVPDASADFHVAERPYSGIEMPYRRRNSGKLFRCGF